MVLATKSTEPRHNIDTQKCLWSWELNLTKINRQNWMEVGINSNTNVLSVVTKNLLSPWTFARSGIKNVGTFLLMLPMLQISVLTYHQTAGFLHIQNYSLWMCKHKLALELLWWLYKFQSSSYDQEKDLIYEQIFNLFWLFPVFLHENPFREQNTGTHKPICEWNRTKCSVWAHKSQDSRVCILLYAVYYISNGPQKLKI